MPITSRFILAMGLRFGLPCPLEVTIQNLAEGCPVPPRHTSEPEEERSSQQNGNANDMSAEQYDSTENCGGRSGQKGEYGPASQDDSSQGPVDASHWIHAGSHASLRSSSPAHQARRSTASGTSAWRAEPGIVSWRDCMDQCLLSRSSLSGAGSNPRSLLAIVSSCRCHRMPR